MNLTPEWIAICLTALGVLIAFSSLRKQFSTKLEETAEKRGADNEQKKQMQKDIDELFSLTRANKDQILTKLSEHEARLQEIELNAERVNGKLDNILDNLKSVSKMIENVSEELKNHVINDSNELLNMRKKAGLG